MHFYASHRNYTKRELLSHFSHNNFGPCCIIIRSVTLIFVLHIKIRHGNTTKSHMWRHTRIQLVYLIALGFFKTINLRIYCYYHCYSPVGEHKSFVMDQCSACLTIYAHFPLATDAFLTQKRRIDVAFDDAICIQSRK